VDGIRGQLLAANGEMRFLIKSGFHRVAVLAALGHDEVPVRFANGFQRLKTLDQLPTWPLVREGVFTPREAELVVERLFTEDGSLMAARLGFEPHPAGEAPPPAPRERPGPQPEGCGREPGRRERTRRPPARGRSPRARVARGGRRMSVRTEEWREAAGPAPSGALPRNEGTELILDWVQAARVNRSAVERRAATLTTRRSVKKQWQAAWLLKAITL